MDDDGREGRRVAYPGVPVMRYQVRGGGGHAEAVPVVPVDEGSGGQAMKDKFTLNDLDQLEFQQYRDTDTREDGEL